MPGLSEILFLAAIVVIVLGAKRLPELGTALRKSFKGFNKGIRGEQDKRKIRDVKGAEVTDSAE